MTTKGRRELSTSGEYQSQQQAVRRVSQKLLETWQLSDPVETLEKTLADILDQVDQQVISDQAISATIYVYDEGQNFYSGAGRGPLREHMAGYAPRRDSLSQYVLTSSQPIFVSDVEAMPADLPPLDSTALSLGVKAFAQLPLMIGEYGQETLVGILLINLMHRHDFDELQQATLRLFADQAAVALQNARVHRRRLREQAAFQAISEAATRQPAEVGQTITRYAVELTKSTYATLWAADLDQGQLKLRGVHRVDLDWYPRQEVLTIDANSINGRVAYTRRAYFTADLDEDPYYARWHDRVRAALCVPLLIRDELIGTLYVASEKENGIAAADQDFIRRLAPQAAIALHNAILLETEHTLRTQAEALQAIVAELLTTLHLETVGQTILNQLKKIVPYRTASLQRVRRNEHRELFAANGFDVEEADPFLVRSVSEDPLIAEVIASGKPRILSDVSQHPAFRPLGDVNSWAAAPLVVDDRVIGLLTLDHHERDFYTEQHRQVLETFANYAALAIRNARLYARERRRNRDLNALNRSAIELNKAREPDQAYQAILEAVVNTLQCHYCTIFLAGADNVLVSHRANGVLFKEPPRLRFAPGEGLAGWVYQTGVSTLVENTAEDSRYRLGPSEIDVKPRSMILSPLRRGRKIIGVISADFDRPYTFDRSDLRLLDTLTLHAGTILENIEYFDDFRILHDAVSRLARQPDLAQIYQTAVEAVLQTLHCTHSTLFIIDRRTGELAPRARVGIPDMPGARRFKLGEGLAGHVAVSGRSLLVNNAAQDSRFIEGNVAPRAAPRSVVLAPIMVENEVIGVISADKDEFNGFTEHNLNMLETLALDVGIAVNVRRQQDRLRAIAEFQRAISDILPAEAQLEQIYEKMSTLMDTSSMFIALYDEETGLIRFPLVYERGKLFDQTRKTEGRPYSPRRYGARRGLTEWVIRRKEALLVEDVDAWEVSEAEVEAVFLQELRCCLVVPALLKDRIVGVIGLQNFDHPGLFDHSHQALLVTIARQVAITLENARLFNETQRQVEQLSTLYQISQELTATLAPDDILEAIAEAVARLLEARHSLFILADPQSRRLQKVTGYNYPREQLLAITFEEVEAGVSGWVLAHKTPALISDAQLDSRNRGVALEQARHFGAASLIVAPLMIRDEVLGTLTAVNTRDDRLFSEADKQLVIMLADQAAIALNNARQYNLINTELARRIKGLQAVSWFQQQISDIHPVEQELQEIYLKTAEAMQDLMDTRNMYIALYDEETDQIEFPLAYQKGRPVPETEKKEGKPYGPRRLGERSGLTEWVIEHKVPLLIEEEFEVRAAQKGIEFFGMKTKCWLGAPMLLREKIIGVIGLQDFKREKVFDGHHQELLTIIASQAAIVIDNARQYERRTEELKAISRFQERISQLDFD